MVSGVQLSISWRKKVVVVLEYANGKIGGWLCGFSKVVGGCILNNLRREFGEGMRRC